MTTRQDKEVTKARNIRDNNWKPRLIDNGWAIVECPQSERFESFVVKLAQLLGTPVARRNGRTVQRIQPLPQELARPQSLSRSYGLGAIPLHIDTAHLPIPDRYIVLGCEDPGDTPSPTILLDTHILDLSETKISYFHSASFFVKNGRKSFYSTIRSKERSFFRFDPGCMQPVSADGENVMNYLHTENHLNSLINIRWEKHQIAIIDNWRMLHGRGNDQPADQRRCLIRISVK